MDIHNWISFEPVEKGTSELDDLVQGKLAKEVQTRLRGQSDPGIDLKSARRAQAIRARAEGGSIIIDEEDQGAVLDTGSRSGREEADPAEPEAASLDDLYRPGSGVPEAVAGPNGSTQLVFRSIRAEDLFGQQIAARKTEMVERTVTDVMRTKVVDAFEESFSELDRLHPELNKR